MLKTKQKILLFILCFFISHLTYATTIKVATISPDGSFWMKQMRLGAKEIKEKTQGRVKFKFYPGGVMGNDENVLRKIRIGQLQGGAITITNLFQSTPDITLYGLPFIFPNLDEAEKIRLTTDKLLSEKIEKSGYINFGFAQGGFTYLMSKQAIHSFDDLRKQKSWVPSNSDVGLSVYRYIGVTPISLTLSDVLTGLQTGLIENVITSPIGAIALQWHTHIKYVVDFPLTYLAAMLIIDKKKFNKIKIEDQKIVRKVMTNVYKAIDDKNKLDNIAARQALINQGVKFIQLNEQEKRHWFEAGDFVIAEMKKKYKYDNNLFKAVTIKKTNVVMKH